MNEALHSWRSDFMRDPGVAFDRLVRGIVPLGGASQLSFGEILDALFEPGDASLDAAAADWLEKNILGLVPENTSLRRWVSILEDYFRGIATMELSQTGGILRDKHKRLRLWLHGFYEGPDRDPEGAYLMALAQAQNDQRFSPLWRRLTLGEELAGRPYLAIGILGFRKMPEQDGRESSGVPEGLLQALVELADKEGTDQAEWKRTLRSLFATYRRSKNYWVEHLASLLPDEEKSKAHVWLSDLLAKNSRGHPQQSERNQAPVRRAPIVPVEVSKNWAKHIRKQPELCDTPAFLTFLGQHRAYVETTGDAEYINKTFNNLSTNLIKADRRRTELAVGLMEEALNWAPWNPHNWTSYAIVLCAASREGDAIHALWKARHRFAWDPFIRSELGRILRENGDLTASEGVLREAADHLPGNAVCRNSLAETLRQMGELEKAREVYEQACRDFPGDVVCRAGLADLLIDLNDVDAAERIFREALKIDERNRAARGGLARALSIRSARSRNLEMRDEAKRILQKLADEEDLDAKTRLQAFDDQWERAITDPTITFRRETETQQPKTRREQHGRKIAEMTVAERLGRAMIALWQAERTDDANERSAICAHATALLAVPEEQIDGDLFAAFVETRGLVLLASGHARKALAYFEKQISHYGRGGWIGIQLGDQRARIVLGLPKDTDDTVEAPSSQSARFALHVARVIQKLSADPPESEVRKLLKTLYPLAARPKPDAEDGSEMLGAFLQTRWFLPAGVQSAEDFDRPDVLRAVVKRINNTQTETFDVISNSILALAA